MNLVGNQRGNSRDMAHHLLKAENEEVIVHQMRGFLGRDLQSAFQESYAVSLGTKCKQHLYSLSLNPPKQADVSPVQFEEAIDRAEKRLGLTGQPRAIVFHHKRGRDGALRVHAHAVWCRIDAENMRAIQMSYDHTILNALGRELFLENGWDLPRGYEGKAERDPLNYTHAEHQQAKRRGKYAPDIKKMFRDTWAQSDSGLTFATALKEQGYVLALGDHAAFVAIDADGEVYSIARALGTPTKDVRARLQNIASLPDVEQAQGIAAALTTPGRERPAPQQAEKTPESPATKRIKNDPAHLLALLTEKESVFTRHDIAKALSTHLNDPQDYQNALQAIMSSRDLVELVPDNPDTKTKARYSTREMIAVEEQLLNDAQMMAGRGSIAPPVRRVRQAVDDTAKNLMQSVGVKLSREQRAAVFHVTGDEQLCCVVGAAGAGKSTILSAAKQAWEASGHRVLGAALAGKAAKGLEQSAGIKSRTLASYELSWQNERNQLQAGDVLVIDEAGMIGSKQMGRLLSEAKDKGAKVVLVGDAEQLQPIEAGAPYRAITEKVQPATLHEVHRQRDEWQRQASQNFALGKTQEALRAHAGRGGVEMLETQEDAIQALVSDYLNAFWSDDGPASQIALAHRRADVRAINDTIRDARKEAGELEDAQQYETAHGRREFAAGDRLLFTRNDRDVGVKNGMLGTVVETSDGGLSVTLDDDGDRNKSSPLKISTTEYNDIEYGYATTIHKAQGATVDQAFVLASRSMDRHLAYVAMTRHRDQAKLYADRDEFSSQEQMLRTLSRERRKQSTLDVAEKPNNKRAAAASFTSREDRLKAFLNMQQDPGQSRPDIDRSLPDHTPDI